MTESDADKLARRYGATFEDVKALNKFPTIAAGKVSPEDVDGWLTMRAGFINSILASKGVETPLSGPPDFVEMLKMAIIYGAAAMLELTPVARDREKGESSTSVYEARYQQAVDWLNGLMADQLANMGITVSHKVPLSTTAPSPFGGGLVMAGNDMVDSPVPWYDCYPWSYIGMRR